jgi:WD40 repeat protein
MKKELAMRKWSTVALCLIWLGLASGPLGRCQSLVVSDKKAAEGDRSARTDVHGDPLPPGAIDRLGTVRLRHIVRDFSGAACLAFSPDGKTLVSGGDVGALVWDVATGKELAWFNDRSPATAAHFSPDGKTLITADNGGAIRHWEVGTGKALRQRMPAAATRFNGREAFFSADGRVLGVWGHSGEVILWEVDTGKQILQGRHGPRSVFNSAALSPDGKTLVISGEGNRAYLLDKTP